MKSLTSGILLLNFALAIVMYVATAAVAVPKLLTDPMGAAAAVTVWWELPALGIAASLVYLLGSRLVVPREH